MKIYIEGAKTTKKSQTYSVFKRGQEGKVGRKEGHTLADSPLSSTKQLNKSFSHSLFSPLFASFNLSALLLLCSQKLQTQTLRTRKCSQLTLIRALLPLFYVYMCEALYVCKRVRKGDVEQFYVWGQYVYVCVCVCCIYTTWWPKGMCKPASN